MTELVRSILGALILSPVLLESVDLAASDFPAGRERETFEVIADLWEDTRAIEIDAVILAARLRGDGASAFVGSLHDGAISVYPDVFRGRVRELRKYNQKEKVRSAVSEWGKDLTPDPDLTPAINAIEAFRKFSEESSEEKSPLMTFADFRLLEGTVEWTIENLLPTGGVTMLTGPTGIGKTWLALQIAHAVSTGTPLFGLAVKQRTVLYVGLEDPMSVTKERAFHLGLNKALIWHGSFAERPPKMDSPDWILYKKFAPPNSLIIFDTVRQCHEMEENSSEAPATVLGRWKEIRDLGHEILAIHHPTKANATNPRGAGGWTDGCDHTLSLVRHGKGEDETDEGGAFEPGCLLTLGTGRKSRYEAQDRLYVRMQTNPPRLVLAESPDAEAIDALADYIAGEGRGKNQGEIIAWATAKGVGPKKRQALIALLNRAERDGYWITSKGFKGSKHYKPPFCPSRSP